MKVRHYSLLMAIASSLITSHALSAPMMFSLAETGTDSTGIRPTPDGSTPKQIILEVGYFESPRTGFAIENVVPDPVERILTYQPSDPPSKTWTITESNSAEFGLDWQAFEAAFLGPIAERNLYLNLGDQPGRFGEHILFPGVFPRPQLRLIAFDLERIEIDLEYWFWHPVLNTLWAHRVEARVYGDGVLVPEPAAIGLATLTGMMLCLVRTGALVPGSVRFRGR